MKKAKELKNKYNYKKIWLATEDANIYKMFKDEFGDVLIDNNQFMFGDTGDKVIADIEVNRPNHRYRLGMEYLSSIYIISKCKYIIGGTVTAMLGAWILSNGFEKQKYVYIWDLGCYRIRKREKCKNIFQKFLSVKDEVYEDTKYKVLIILGKYLRSPFRTKVKNFNKVPYIAEEE